MDGDLLGNQNDQKLLSLCGLAQKMGFLKYSVEIILLQLYLRTQISNPKVCLQSVESNIDLSIPRMATINPVTKDTI
jgi:hypothetical protein